MYCGCISLFILSVLDFVYLYLYLSITSLLMLLFFQGFTYIDPSLLDTLGTSTSRDHALSAHHHHRTEEMEKQMDDEDIFHKNVVPKKPKLETKIQKSAPTHVVQAGICDSKRTADQFQRGVLIYI